jgi:D-glycero-D-manno-heptose 1,7-bisphosphate phosphatase
VPLINKIDNIFLDRDGVINIDSGYVHKWSDFKFIEGSIEALNHLYRLGLNLIIVTNQAGIAKGHFTADDYHSLNNKMLEEMDSYEINVLDVFHCPHHKDGVIPELSKECNSRKPKPGMIFAAADKYNFDLSRSIIIGDRESDLISGKNANLYGCYLVGSDEYSLIDSKNSDGCFDNLYDFVFNFFIKE